MKKRIALLLATIFAVSSLAVGCGDAKNAENDTEKKNNDTTAQEGTANEGTTAEGGLKTGLALSTSLDGSSDGAAQADVTMAAVTVDADGKIVECVIDSVQSKIEFDAKGQLTTDVATEFKTKNELGPDYGMKKFGNAVAEWNEQAAAFAAYCVGKTADEVTGMAVTEEGKAADEDLAASCTIYVGGFQALVAKAAANAVDMGAQAGDKLGLGVATNMAKSTSAAADKEGVAQTYATVAVTTTNADGKITSAVIDAVQADVNFDATGKVTTDLTAAVPSKNELGDAYGMKSASAIGKEWNEQAAAYAAYAVGKTADEVNATAVTEGVPSDADLAASVTVHIADFNTVITKAVNSAK